MSGYDQEIDKQLSKVESILLETIIDLKLLGGSIMRWRWDEPAITCTWGESPIGKSLQVTYLEESGKFEVGISAWKDFDERDGGRLRRWNGKVIDTVQQVDLPKTLREALTILANWREVDLVKEDRIRKASGV